MEVAGTVEVEFSGLELAVFDATATDTAALVVGVEYVTTLSVALCISFSALVGVG